MQCLRCQPGNTHNTTDIKISIYIYNICIFTVSYFRALFRNQRQDIRSYVPLFCRYIHSDQNKVHP